MKTDPLLTAIREARHQISRECGHDPYRLIEYYKARQRKLGTDGKRKFAKATDSASLVLHEKPESYRTTEPGTS